MWGFDDIEYIETNDSAESYNNKYLYYHIIDSLIVSGRYTPPKT